MKYTGTKYNAQVRLTAAIAAFANASRNHKVQLKYCNARMLHGRYTCGAGRLRIAERVLANAERRLSIACDCWLQVTGIPLHYNTKRK
jgi:hypothetical protein